MAKFCTKCGAELSEGAQFCTGCGAKVEQQQIAPAAPPPTQMVSQPQQVQSPTYGIWFQNFYRIRKKVLALTNKYWIEDHNGNLLGFCKQKMFKLKEDIRIFTDDSESQELFRIKQEQILDVWGTFAVLDSVTGMKLGYIKRKLMSELGRDAWQIYNMNNQLIGEISEKSLGRALTRKYIPGGGLVPEKMTIDLNGQPVAEVNQQFKLIGDIWEMSCQQVPPDFDRRVLLSTMLLMGAIERDRK